MKQKKFKTIPTFLTEDEERDFWNSHDSSDYIDWAKAKISYARENESPVSAIKKLIAKHNFKSSKRKINNSKQFLKKHSKSSF